MSGLIEFGDFRVADVGAHSFSTSASSPTHSPNGADTRLSRFLGSGRITDKPHLTACCSDRSRHTVADSWIWQSRPLRIKWQDWIALSGGIIVHRNAASGSIML